VEQRLEAVRERIRRAAERAGRDPDEITLVAVSKIKPAADLRAAYAAGQRDFGESYVQEFQQKSAEIGDLADARFHLIGALQSNKARPAAELFHVVQAVHNEKLCRRLNKYTSRPLDIYFEVKLSGEESKSGMDPAEIGALADYVSRCENLRLRGLMTMPPWSEDPEVARPYFRRLRELAREHSLDGLSMGMSNDFETAIEEGATLVRIGSTLMEGVEL